jgi:hypothetical protein
VAPVKGAGFIVAFLHLHHGRAMGTRSQLGAAWLAEGARRKKGPRLASARLKKAIRHPPDDHVIIVFDAVKSTPLARKEATP